MDQLHSRPALARPSFGSSRRSSIISNDTHVLSGYRRSSHRRTSKSDYPAIISCQISDQFLVLVLFLMWEWLTMRLPEHDCCPGQSTGLLISLQVYAGPVSESIPSSITGFAYRSRADSTASFTYFQEHDDSPKWPDDAVIEDDSDEESILGRISGAQIDNQSMHSNRRRFSEYASGSAHERLLTRQDSRKTNASLLGRDARINQKIYVVTEDLTIVVAGFTTRPLGFIVYLISCIASLGLGFLVFRWLPRWRVRLIGSPKPLQNCSWAVIEVRPLFQASDI